MFQSLVEKQFPCRDKQGGLEDPWDQEDLEDLEGILLDEGEEEEEEEEEGEGEGEESDAKWDVAEGLMDEEGNRYNLS